MKMRLAVTGARGRIAPHVISDLESYGASVTGFSRTAGDSFSSLEDLLRPEILAGYDAVLHFGWSSVPLIAEQFPERERELNFPFLLRILEASAACSLPPQFLFFSTAAVYGNTHSPATESDVCLPLGHYARAKLEAEGLIAEAIRRHPALRCCILRVSNVFGFSTHSAKPQGVISRFCEAVHDGTSVPIWGDGSATKDYLFHQDFLAALRVVLQKRLTGTFNLVSGQSLSLNEIITLVEETTGKKLRIDRQPHYDWDVETTNLSGRKLFEATGWKASHDARGEIHELIRRELP